MIEDNLTGWRDAAEAGGFPEPARPDRWQALRAGVVNLWEFDVAEYWYALGWAQLTGRNETGKSSLMALTTLIPWLADTSSSNIDTLGRSGKKFRYYVEATGADGDRRPTDTSTNRGWLWVEYGRLSERGPEFFTTLLFAEARSASSNLRLDWCTAWGSLRVRQGLDLVTDRVVASPRELDAPGLVAHATGRAYKEEVATRLLGSKPDRLESVGKMLKVTRTPKLGAQLEVGFVQKHLREALPELERSEVDALAAGWDELDQIRVDLRSAQRAAEVVSDFARRGWLPWVRARLRLAADEAAAARTAFDRVTREERAAAEEVEELRARERALAEAMERSTRTASGLRSAAAELESSTRFQDARGRVQRLEQWQERVTERLRQLRDLDGDVTRADSAAQEAEAEAAQRAETLAARSTDFAAAGAALAAALRTAMPAGAPVDDLPRVRQALLDRLAAVSRARQQLREAGESDAHARSAEALAESVADRAAGHRRDAEAAWASAQAARDALITALVAWSRTAEPAVPGELLDAWLDGLPTSTDVSGAPSVSDLVRAEWLEPAREPFLRAEADARTRAGRLEIEVVDVDRRIEELAAARAPDFAEPTAWARRARPAPGADGAPLWAIVDPLSPDADLAGVEAALAAASLLDAWVTRDGVYLPDRDGADLVVTGAEPAAPGRQRLTAVLQPSPEAGSLSASADRLLNAVALVDEGDDLPAAGLAVGTDGRWRGSGLTGRALPMHGQAEWLGEAARAARRRRRAEELAALRLQLTESLGTARADAEAANARLRDLAGLHASCPSDAELRRLLGVAAERDRVATIADAGAHRATEEAVELRARAESRHAALLQFTAEHGLPHTSPALDEVVEALHRAQVRAQQVGHAAERKAEAAASADAAKRRVDAARALRERAADRHRAASASLDEARRTVRALESTIGADDRQLLAELSDLKARVQQAEVEGAAHQRDQVDIAARLGSARTSLAAKSGERQAATRQRDATFGRFRTLVDEGLTDEVEVELPERDSAAVDKVREQVAVVRRRVEPAGWPDDPARQADHLQTALHRLTSRANDARMLLEEHGRTLRMTLDSVPRIEVLVDSSGTTLGARKAAVRLAQIHQELSTAYSQRVQETLDELLGSTFLEHLRARLGATHRMIGEINAVLTAHPTGTTSTSLRIVLVPAGESSGKVLQLLQSPSLVNPEVQAQVRDFLRIRVDEAKRTAADAGEADWRDRLAANLDYRAWFEVHLEKRIGAAGRWVPLTAQGFAEMSGGARAVILMLPLVATLAALYGDMSGAPRPLWLDEAFDGLDASNRAMVMDLFRDFDLDVLVAGPGRLVNVRTVPAAAIYQVVRAPAPLPGADLTLELWAGGDLHEINLPVAPPPALVGAGAVDPAQDSLL